MTDNPGFIYLAAPYSTGLIATSPTVRRVAMLRRRHHIDTAAAQLISEGHVVYSPVSHGCAIEPHIRTTMTHDSEDLIVWADGTMCFAYELHEMTHMSDDYKRIPYDSEEWELAHAEYCR